MNQITKHSVPSAQRPSCIIVEDEVGFAQMLREVVQDAGGEPLICGSIQTAREQVAQRAFDVTVLDNHLPDGKGFNFYFELVKRDPSATVIVLTGLPELAQAVELTRNGLFDYLAKPINREDLAACLRRAFTRVRHLKVDLRSTELVASSPGMREVVQSLQQAARHPTTAVLLIGETGVGKDLAARVLHRWTFAQPDEVPFVALNCAAVPAEMFEAELFGAEKGAYTGADKLREGLVGAARHGTLFLDEIAEVPLAAQAKLLRFLESREYRSLGGTATKRFEGRVVAATNRSLRNAVAKGQFREDLFYRLDVFTVHLPPLRERADEIPSLAENLLAQLALKYGRSRPRLKPEDLEPLRKYAFPGNARELRNLLERSLLRTPADSGWLALDLAWLKTEPVALELPPPPPVQTTTEQTPSSLPAERRLTPLELQEYQLIRKTLIEEKGGIRRTAAKIGLTHQTLLRRLQKWPELREGLSNSAS